ncbi:hypothetical protein ABZ885_38965, partial [Kitasatospora sp. NPDC047058]
MNRRRTAALVVATVLAADGLLHVYWATGSTWPAADAPSLSRAVLNAEVPFTPRVVLPLAAVLFSGAAVVLARGGRAGADLDAAVDSIRERLHPA